MRTGNSIPVSGQISRPWYYCSCSDLSFPLGVLFPPRLLNAQGTCLLELDIHSLKSKLTKTPLSGGRRTHTHLFRNFFFLFQIEYPAELDSFLGGERGGRNYGEHSSKMLPGCRSRTGVEDVGQCYSWFQIKYREKKVFSCLPGYPTSLPRQ